MRATAELIVRLRLFAVYCLHLNYKQAAKKRFGSSDDSVRIGPPHTDVASDAGDARTQSHSCLRDAPEAGRHR